MPVMDGQTAVPLILKENPAVRIIMVSTLSVRGGKETLRALSLGAADYVPKPTTVRGAMSLKDITAELMRKIRVLGRRTQATSADGPLPSRRLRRPGAGSPRILAIGASTGGPTPWTKCSRLFPRPFRRPSSSFSTCLRFLPNCSPNASTRPRASRAVKPGTASRCGRATFMSRPETTTWS